MSSHLVLRASQRATPSLWQWQSVISGVRSKPTDPFISKRFSVSTSANQPGATKQTRAVLPQPSYLHGASPTPLLGVTIGQRLEWAAERVPEREAFVFCKRNVRLTFAQYLQQVPQQLYESCATTCQSLVQLLSGLTYCPGGQRGGRSARDGRSARRPRGPVGRELARVGAVARGRPARRRPGREPPPGLQTCGDRVRPQ